MVFGGSKLKGFLNFRRQAEEEAATLPALMTHAERVVSTVIHGEHAQSKSGAGERFWQYREYVPEDRPQDIDWRQSGKTDRIYIKQKELQTAQKAIFWASGAKGMRYHSEDHLPTKLQTAQILSLALGILMVRAGEQVSLLWRKKSGSSDLALERLARGLSDDLPDRALPEIELTPPAKNAQIFLAGDFLDPFEDIQSCFKTLSSHTSSVIVLQVLDPAELSLNFEGRAVFEDPSGKIAEHVANIPSVRAAYQEKVKAHIDEIQSFCRRYGWTYQLHVTDQPIAQTLSNLWLSLQSQTNKMREAL